MKPQLQAHIFDAVPESLEPIRSLITSFGSVQGIDKNKIYKLCLAVDEIASNIINYGYPMAGINDGTINVSIDYNDNKLTIVLEDYAVPFDPLRKLLPTPEDLAKPIEEKSIGGLGILIARQSVDAFNYEFTDGKNRNIFVVDTD